MKEVATQSQRRVSRYMQIAQWAQRRYTHRGVLVLDTGKVKSAYSRIEEAAWDRYMRNPRDADGCLVFPA
jgi:hypothetical protein